MLQVRVLALCFLVALFDGFDTQAIAYTGPAMLADFALAPTALAPVLTAGIIGMALGAMLLGSLADRFGRRPVVLGAVVLFSLATLATAWTRDLNQIIVLRFIAGLGMGGATPVMLALVSEYVPSRQRGIAVTGILLGLPAGAMLGGLLAAHALPLIGWEGIFIVGGLAPALLLVVMLFGLPESAQYLITRKGSAQAADSVARLLRIGPDSAAALAVDEPVQRSGVSALLAPALRRTTLTIWATYLFNWVAWFMLLSWLPTVLKQLGLSATQAPLATVTVNAAFILFAVPLSILLPRVCARRVLLWLLGVGIGACLGLSYAGDQWQPVFVFIALAGVGVGGQQLALNYLVVSAYPTALRATATGCAIGMGRVGAIMGSAMGGMVLAQVGGAGFFLVLIVPLVFAAVAVLAVREAASHGKSGALVTAH
jgi:AAHS family 4-hydroxybenzoate transporter-like MFS transporter